MAGTLVTQIIGQRERPVALALRAFGLECLRGPDAGKVWPGDRRSLSIGSHAPAEVVLADPHVSRLHARIDVEDEAFVLRDLGSTNGTFAAGLRLHQVGLADGACFELGATQLRFRVGAGSFQVPLADHDDFEGLIGRSVAMRELFALCQRLAATEVSVLIEGETGTGKELVARALHRRSPRRERPFVVFDCGAVPAALIESELFGHERGAFTGAVAARAGVFERADGGTLFLDEIGELALELQPRLLRALESGVIQRLGSERSRQVDVRVVAATHRDLARLVGEQRFRADLFYRLAVARLEVPPLRARRDDVPLLAAGFARASLASGVPLPDGALAMLFERYRRHDWPGNVRELRNAVERVLAAVDGPTLAASDALGAAQVLTRSLDRSLEQRISLEDARAAHDRDYLIRALASADGDVAEAARLADIHPKSFERLLRKHHLR